MRSSTPVGGKDASGCKMRFRLHDVSAARPRRTSFGPGLRAIAAGLALALAGCTVGQDARPQGAMVTEASALPTYVPGGEVVPPVPMAFAPAPQPRGPIIQVRYSAPPEASGPALTAPLPERLPATEPVPAAMSLDQAIAATLLADPKIRAGLEAIHQANADLLTASLPPNPTLIAQGQFLPLQPFTPATPGGPTEFDVQVGYPVDWFLFGKRAAAMASARLGVRQSEADYADLVRQRVTATATGLLRCAGGESARCDLAREDTDNLDPAGSGDPAGRGRRRPPAGRSEPRAFGPS